ncbi:MAG TPA: hypothetical protein VG245_10145, partial [Candidatus Dormibacteraeota bacterium]|nr:hypothetical protein [Candidatus Dormibacteraeota bacterium]
QAALQTEICTLAPQVPGCPAIAQSRNPLPGGTPATPRAGTPAPTPPAVDPTLRQQTEDLLLKYLLR